MPTTMRDTTHEMLTQFSSAWNEGGRNLGDFFAVDASLINPFGERADGQGRIAAMYAQYFDGMLAGTRSRIDVSTTRQVGDRHALVDATQTISAPDGAVVLALHLVALLVRGDDGWRFLDSRPYSCTSPTR